MDRMDELRKFLPELDDDHDCADHLKPVASHIHFKRIPLLVSSVRKKCEKSCRQTARDGVTPLTALMDCTILSPALFGSYHIVFILKFTDGIQWILKVPAGVPREKFDESAAGALTSEALTMRLLRRETTIPIPEVFSFDASFDNEINCPFILMEYVQGVQLSDCWFNDTASKADLERRRARILQDLAPVMLQMNRFKYFQGGSPLYDKNGSPTGVGPMASQDVISSTPDNSDADDESETQDGTKSESDDENLPSTDGDDESSSPCDLGPFSDTRSFILSSLNQRSVPPDTYSQGIYKMLRLFIDWIPSSAGADGVEFVLTHPDFDIQNVLVSKEGNLRGLIDWDGVAAVPRCRGNERYPSWLTRDWDPMMYGYTAEPAADGDTRGPENSPEELAFYRSTYLQIMEKCNPSEEGIRLTRNSIIIENLGIAADQKMCTHEIVRKIFNEIVLRGSCKNPKGLPVDNDLYHYDVTLALGEGDLDQHQLQWLKSGFEALFA